MTAQKKAILRSNIIEKAGFTKSKPNAKRNQ